MKFEKLALKNFRSFGNNLQELILGRVGLTALKGKNGSGKTSLAEAIEFALFGKVRGRRKKQSNKASLANRFNKNLQVQLDLNSYTVDRCSQPDSFTVTKNGRNYVNEHKKELERMPEEIFTNFISFNSKDFKDFLHLSKHDRDMVLDKLFNMYVFVELQEYVEKMQSDNLTVLNTLQNDDKKYQYSVEKISKKVEEIRQKKERQKSLLEEDLQTKMSSLKPIYENIQGELLKITECKKKFNEKWQKMQSGLSDAKAKLSVTQEQLKLYDQSKCPTCGSSLNEPNHTSIKETLLIKVEKYKKAISSGQDILNKIKTEATSQTSGESELQEKLTDVLSEIKMIKNKKEILSDVTEEDKDWTEEIKNLSEKSSALQESMKKAERLNEVYILLLDVLDVDKNRSSLLKKLLPKLNQEVTKNVSSVGMSFSLIFDEEMTCEIQQLGSKIDEDTLSEGEVICLNTGCLLAFMKLANISKYTNVIFMDETFENVDEDNIQVLLKMIRNYAKEEGLEVFLIQHRQMPEEFFDRVVKVEKSHVFSNIISQ